MQIFSSNTRYENSNSICEAFCVSYIVAIICSNHNNQCGVSKMCSVPKVLMQNLISFSYHFPPHVIGIDSFKTLPSKGFVQIQHFERVTPLD